MFSILREISQSGAFQTFIEHFIGHSEFLERQTHGVRLAFDEAWLGWWYHHHWYRFIGPIPPPGVMRPEPSWFSLFRTLGFPLPSLGDLRKRPNWWKRYCSSRGWRPNVKPIRIMLSLRPGTAMTKLSELHDTDYDEYPIQFEVRPLVQAHSSRMPITPLIGGISIGPSGGIRTESGTLGGVVRRHGTSLALTCAHVLDGGIGDEVWHPAASDDARARRVGQILAVERPTPKTSGKCNRTATYASRSDVAVVSLDSGVDSALSIRKLGPVSSLRPIDEIGEYEPAVFTGKESDRCKARTEQLSHWQEITIDGQPHCYQDLFTIGSREHHYVLQEMSRAGDSGAWILSDDEVATRELLGMLIGGDGERSFCAFAENVFLDASIDPNDVVFQ